LELGKQCFCSNTVDDSQEVDASKCDTPCAGDSAHSCGGGLRVEEGPPKEIVGVLAVVHSHPVIDMFTGLAENATSTGGLSGIDRG